MQSNPLRILIATGDATFNSGDEAIFASVLSLIRDDFPEAEITTFSESPAKTCARYNVRAVRLGTTLREIVRHWPNLLRAVASCDVMVWGGGNLIQDASSVLYTPYHMTKVLAARLFGKPVFAYCIGVGPVQRALTRGLIQTIGRFVDHYTVRDSRAAELLIRNRIPRKCVDVVADPALVLEPDDRSPDWPSCVDERPALPHMNGWVGLAPRRLFLRNAGLLPMKVKVSHLRKSSPSYRRQEAWNDGMARWADHVIKTYGLGVLFIPMYCGVGQRDDLICQEIRRRMTRPGEARILKPDLEIDELLRVYRSLSIVVGIRYHSLILSLATGRPFVALNYTQKGRSLTERLRYERHSLDAEALCADDLIQLFDEAWAHREQLTKLSQANGASLRGLAREAQVIFSRFVRRTLPCIAAIRPLDHPAHPSEGMNSITG